jgi:hypothetical protein
MKLIYLLYVLVFNFVCSRKSKNDFVNFDSEFKNFGKFASGLFKDESPGNKFMIDICKFNISS